MAHFPIRNDRRYTVTHEWAGYERPQWVVRFCDEWIDCRSTYGAAIIRAVGHNAERNVALIIEEKMA